MITYSETCHSLPRHKLNWCRSQNNRCRLSRINETTGNNVVQVTRGQWTFLPVDPHTSWTSLPGRLNVSTWDPDFCKPKPAAAHISSPLSRNLTSLTEWTWIIIKSSLLSAYCTCNPNHCRRGVRGALTAEPRASLNGQQWRSRWCDSRSANTCEGLIWISLLSPS